MEGKFNWRWLTDNSLMYDNYAARTRERYFPPFFPLLPPSFSDLNSVEELFFQSNYKLNRKRIDSLFRVLLVVFIIMARSIRDEMKIDGAKQGERINCL